MTSKEAIRKARERKGLPLNTECAIITDNELKVIEKDLEVLEIFKNCFVIINDELMFSISPKQEEKIKRWLNNEKNK